MAMVTSLLHWSRTNSGGASLFLTAMSLWPAHTAWPLVCWWHFVFVRVCLCTIQGVWPRYILVSLIDKPTKKRTRENTDKDIIQGQGRSPVLFIIPLCPLVFDLFSCQSFKHLDTSQAFVPATSGLVDIISFLDSHLQPIPEHLHRHPLPHNSPLDTTIG